MLNTTVWLYKGYAKKQFLAIVNGETAAENFCRNSSEVRDGEFIYLRTKYNIYRYRYLADTQKLVQVR